MIRSRPGIRFESHPGSLRQVAMAHDTPSDRLVALLQRCAMQDRRAFDGLYHAVAPKLYGVALRILGRDSWAEEALQDSFVNIWRHAGRYDTSRGRPMTWMINIVRNRALDMRRSATYRTDEVAWSADADRRVSGDDPLARTETNRELARVMRCLSELAEPQRRCILLMYHRGFTAVEAAARLALPVGTVKTWARRGLIAVRECLAR